MTTETIEQVRVRSVEIVVGVTVAVDVAPPSKRRRSLRALGGFLGALVVMNIALATILEVGPVRLRDPEYGLRLQSLRERQAQFPNRKLTVVLGSSRTAMGIRPDIYETSVIPTDNPPLLFNMSMAGAGPVFQRMTLERLLNDGVTPDAILFEFWPALLRGDGLYREDRRMIPERLHTTDDPIVRDYFTDPAATRAQMRTNRLLPAWYNRRSLLEQFCPQLLPWSERTDGAWSTLDGWGWLPGRKTYTAEQVERGWPHVAGFYAPLFQSFEIADQFCALFNKPMTTLGKRGMDGARDGEHFPPLFPGQASGDERAALQRCFHHQHAARQPADDAIAAWKILRHGWRTKGELGNYRTVRGELIGQIAVACRINNIQAGTHYRNRRGASVQATAMRCRIDTQRHAADNCKSGIG